MTFDEILKQIKQFRRKIRIVRHNVQGSCKRPPHGKCAVKSYAKSLGYGNFNFEWYKHEQGVHVKSVYPCGGNIISGFCSDFDCTYAVNYKNERELTIAKALDEDFKETFNEMNVRCLKCKYHCGR